MGVAAILVMWPGLFESILRSFYTEKFENVDRRATE